MTNPEIIKSYLRLKDPIKIETIPITTSTNENMKKRARLGEKEIAVLVADRQTSGKGSKGRSFFSPENTGIYMSFLLRPALTPPETTLITTMAAVALCEAIESLTDLEPKIKWVNDIFLGGKKVAGILTEGAYKNGNKIDFAVLGIGVNLSVPAEGFPEQIRDIAGTLGCGEIKDRLIAEIINRFVLYYKRLPNKSFMQGYKDRLFILGKDVTVTRGETSFVARAVDIDDMCALVVRTPDGQEQKLSSGEISIRVN